MEKIIMVMAFFLSANNPRRMHLHSCVRHPVLTGRGEQTPLTLEVSDGPVAAELSV